MKKAFVAGNDIRDSNDLRAHSKFGLVCVLGVLCVLAAHPAPAQHLRIFACAIANDSAGAFMGGSSNGSGLYQSDDTGKTWKHLGWDNIKCYSMDMVQSSNGRILYEATGLGVLRSTDYGAAWKQFTDWRISEAMDVAVNQKNSDEIYIATAHGPWWTRDAGQKWEILPILHQEPYLERINFDKLGKLQWLSDDDEADDARIVVVPNSPDFKIRLVGTLRNGVLRNEYSTLPRRQIWTLKSFLVTP